MIKILSDLVVTFMWLRFSVTCSNLYVIKILSDLQ